MRKLQILKIGLLLFCALILFVAGYLLGSNSSGKLVSSMLDEVQGELAYNYYSDIEGIRLDLKNGCDKTVIDKLAYNSDQQLYLLASFIQESKNEKLNDYVKSRSPNDYEKAKAYDLNKDRSGIHSFPECGLKSHS